jgi:hypothetical protein
MIKDNFKYTQENFPAACKEAAAKGVPIVVVCGGWEHNNSRSLIQESLPQARQGAGNEAVYVYVDRAKCKNQELARLADSQFAGGHNAAVSVVFSLKPAADGKPTLGESLFRWQGGHSSAKMDPYKGQFKLDGPDASPDAVPAPSPTMADMPELSYGRPDKRYGMTLPRSERPSTPGQLWNQTDSGPPGWQPGSQAGSPAEEDEDLKDFYRRSSLINRSGLTNRSNFGLPAPASERPTTEKKVNEEESQEAKRRKQIQLADEQLEPFEY